jgi:cardiolipin synthase
VAERTVENSAGAGELATRPDRVLTLPNVLSVLRLAGVPLFLWLLLGPRADLAAFAVLVASGITDWLDGKLARWLGQSSRFGAMLDPAVDRLYIFATLIAFGLREIVPWWVIIVLVGRDVLIAACLPVLRRRGYGPLEVHYLGKAATLCLLYAFPLLLLAQGDSTAAQIARPVAYAFTIWGGALYLWSAVLYVIQVAAAVRAPPDPQAPVPGPR